MLLHDMTLCLFGSLLPRGTDCDPTHPVYNLTNGIDVEETKQKTEWYRKENQAIIMKIRERQVGKCVCGGGGGVGHNCPHMVN